MKPDKKKINKILLISPHKITVEGYKEDLAPPLGLAYLAAVLEEDHYVVKIIDLAAEGFNHREFIEEDRFMIGLSFNETADRIRAYRPDLVGISCLFSSQFHDVMKLCRLAKEIDKDIITVVGGEHPSAMPEESLRNPDLDFVFIGESEYTFRDFIRSLNTGADITGIDGFGYKENGHIRINPKTKYIENLDSLPLPARHLLPMSTYFKINIPQSGTSLRFPNTTMMTSRGCTAQCIFCATTQFWGRKFRVRSSEKVLAELEHLIKTYGIKEIGFIDDNLTLDKTRIMEIFQGMIDHHLNLVWNTPQGLSVNALDEELLSKMKEAGCYEVTLAIESGDEDVLARIVKKPIRLEKVKRLVTFGKKIGLIVKGYFVIGLPGETKEQMFKTVEFAKRLKLDAAGIFIATPLPGTELYKICKEKRCLVKNFDWSKINYGVGSITTDSFIPRDVEKIVSRAMLEINLSLLYHDPWKFFRKYWGLLRRNPSVLFNHVRFLVKKL